jgi:excisionase family DNA binding protein
MATFTTPSKLPTDEDIALARESGRELTRILQQDPGVHQIDLRDAQGVVRPLRIPMEALRLMRDALSEIGQGNAVAITSVHAEMTSQEAAELLNVSRPFLVQLLEKGEIPFRKVGTHRRVRYEDVMSYKKSIDSKRLNALEELAAQAQELGMGY